MSDFKGKMALAKNDNERLDLVLAEIKDIADDGGTVELVPESATFLLTMIGRLELSLCQNIVIHNNALTVMGCALIELEKGDTDAAQSWLFEHCDHCEAGQWEAMTDADKYYKEIRIPWCQSVAEHQANIKIHDEKYNALNSKRDEMQKADQS